MQGKPLLLKTIHAYKVLYVSKGYVNAFRQHHLIPDANHERENDNAITLIDPGKEDSLSFQFPYQTAR